MGRMSQSALLLMSIATGVFFCVWPLRMNQSGLPGPAAMFVYASVTIVASTLVLLLSGGAWEAIRGRALWIGVQAGVLNVLGVLAFTTMLSKASPLEAPRQILIAIITQTTLNGVWASYQAGSLEPRFALGFVTALATVWLMR